MKIKVAAILDICILAVAFSTLKGQTIITNGDFEKGTGGNVDNWIEDAWRYVDSIFIWEDSAGIDGSHCICISVDSGAANDARFYQELEGLEPTVWYNLNGWLKGENIVSNGKTGSSLCILDTWNRSESFTGTFEWTQVSLKFQADSLGKAKIACRLGFWGSTAYGRAWFDNISMSKCSTRESEYFTFLLEENDLSAIADSNFVRWSNHLDSAYICFYKLTGFYPFNGSKITIKSVDEYPGGWAVAGNPIKWHQIYVYNELKSINDYDDWSFGILHEIGHNFDDNGWNFDAEFFANFKMYYVLDVLHAKVRQAGIFYIGSEIDQFYESRYVKEKGEFNLTGELKGYSGCLMHRFIQIQKIIGWEPIINTFHYLYDLPDSLVSDTKLYKYFMFLDILSGFSGVNIYELIPQDDMNEFIAYLGGGIVNQIPEVNIGNDTITYLNDTLLLDPVCKDDQYPNDILTCSWKKLNNPENIWISDSTSSKIHVTFYNSGDYGLELVVSDGQSIAADTVYITVLPPTGISSSWNMGNHELIVYPNPVNSEIYMEFTLIKDSPIDMYLFNSNGEKIMSSSRGSFRAGYTRVVWNDFDRNTLTPGLYLLVIKTANSILSQKVVIYPLH